jgi:hypothetical protein
VEKKRQRLPNSLADGPRDSRKAFLLTGVSAEVHFVLRRAETGGKVVAKL